MRYDQRNNFHTSTLSKLMRVFHHVSTTHHYKTSVKLSSKPGEQGSSNHETREKPTEKFASTKSGLTEETGGSSQKGTDLLAVNKDVFEKPSSVEVVLENPKFSNTLDLTL